MAKTKQLPKEKTSTGAQPIALTQIIQLATDRSYKDISDWKNAIITAESPYNPRRHRLLNLYETLVLDGHIRMIRKQLLHYVSGGEFQIMSDDKSVDKELTKVFKKKWFKNFCKHAIDSILFGHSLMQFKEVNPKTGNIQLELIPRKCVVPERGGWVKHEWDIADNAINYRDDAEAMKWLIEVGEEKDFGELNPATPYILFKKNALQCWSEFCERFGMPMAKAKVNARDINAINRMENFLVNMGSNSYAIIDQSEEIDFVETTKTDSFQVFDKLIERCNSELSKMILLQVMANDVGANGSRAQAEVHEVKSDDVKSSLRSMIEDLVNEVLLPKLAFHGFKTEGKQASYLEVATVNKDTHEQDRWLEENFDVPVEHWQQKYNTPLKARKVKPTVPIVGEKQGDKTNKSEEVKKVKDFINSPVNSIMQMHREINDLYHPTNCTCCNNE